MFQKVVQFIFTYTPFYIFLKRLFWGFFKVGRRKEEEINKVEKALVKSFAVSNLWQLGDFSNLHKDLLSS